MAPRTFEALTKRFDSDEIRSRITLNCRGLSDQSGVCQMYYFPEHPELRCDSPRHDQFEAVPFEAQLTTGDEYCDLQQIDTLEFLKIDVEGAEHRVITGFARRLAAQKVHCVQFEYGASSTQTRFLLADYYALLSPAHWLGKIYPTYVEFADYQWTKEDFRFSNYCAVSKAREDLRALLEK